MAASKKPRMKKKANQLNTCCVAFGSNIISRYGNPLQTVCHAMKEIQTSQFKLTSMSSLYETVAYPKSSGPNFINGCALFKTDWDASEALSHLQEIENRIGRKRNKRWEPRAIDLDLIFFEDLVYPSKEVVKNWMMLTREQQLKEWPIDIILPHPRVQDRAFVLIPIQEIDLKWRHPILRKTAKEMLENINPSFLKEIKKI